MTDPVSPHNVNHIQPLIVCLRGQKAILDFDLARIYGVTTKRLNEQVKRNPDRFPEDFKFRLSLKEVTDLRSQFATSAAYKVKKISKTL